jgi:hypothetical protein
VTNVTKLYNCVANHATVGSSGAYRKIRIHLKHLGKVPKLMEYECIVTRSSATIDGVWIRNRIYLTLNTQLVTTFYKSLSHTD